MAQNTFTYDIYGNQLSQLGQSWENSAWKNSLLQTWSYDEQGHEITHTSQTWTGSAWGGTTVDTEMYNANGQRTSLLSRYLSGSAWVNQYLYTYSYDAYGNETTDLCQMWNGSAWVNSRRWTYTYDANGYYASFLWEVWSNGSWENYGRSIVTNDASGRETYSLQQAWYNGAWLHYSQNTFTYDGNGRKATDLYDTRTINAWVHSQLNSFTYDINGCKTDELEQVWKDDTWENATWYIDHWKKIPTIQVTKPATSEVVLAGEPYMIQWKSAGIDSVKLELSLDGGTTFTTVVRSTAASTLQYLWDVPDALSAKCRIRISDVADTSTHSISSQFRIKGYILTRFKADGDYEPFDPAIHGWQFANTEPNMWPSSWHSQFRYATGSDPYTALRYPPIPFLLSYAHVKSSDFPDWPLFVRAFGIGQCYWDTSVPLYSPRAFRYWVAIKEDWGGSCFGFAVSSLLDFDFPVQFRSDFPQLGSFGNVHDLPINSNTRMVINQLFVYQVGLACQAYRSQQWKRTPQQTIEELKTEFLSETRNDRPLFFQNLVGKVAAHEVVPYKIDRDPAIYPTRFRVYVYDNAYPTGVAPGGARTIIEVDSAQDYWTYAPLGWSSGTKLKGLILDANMSTFLPNPVFPSITLQPVLSKRAAEQAEGSGSYLEMMNSTTASIAITNQAHETIGFHDSIVVNSFSDGHPIVPATTTFQPPIGYYIPDDSYSIRMSAYQDSLTLLSVFGSATVFGYWRTDAVTGQSDNLFYANGIAYGNPDLQVKTVNFDAILSLSTSERQFQILNCAMAKNDSLHVTALDTTGLKVVNLGRQSVYDLDVLLAGATAWGRFVHSSITLPAGSTHYIVPDWQNIQTSPLKVYEDIGNTGVIHDTLMLINQITVVKEQFASGIPQEFRLEQNYPNPFNPSTTIRYGLPVRSHVTLVVFSTLGQRVAVLQDGEQAPGFHEVQFDGTTFASGVYFYRIQAGTFTGVKKLLIVR